MPDNRHMYLPLRLDIGGGSARGTDDGLTAQADTAITAHAPATAVESGEPTPLTRTSVEMRDPTFGIESLLTKAIAE
ncbi:hypothetical protein ACM01_21015 [Streptomyces viridochromogenes]|uniref:Uncharacterized protein n=1 Tax=Streptomyces viridochromogenes TaxID=1938 RepID=A0A0J7ZAZ9_STRVR|nr:hypothetical protein [Streptomyces viridochromogenes]KMS72984.1 hypothetical protein ACM01_21015 [Streptomyces viridochromogenes]KOG14387.1 hypothetical protein ADK35_30985 [Streptomyces viridochromogenes]KOG24205.1 hypothetical protein ADK36_08680 [Streptomyces viridochromogenes]